MPLSGFYTRRVEAKANHSILLYGLVDMLILFHIRTLGVIKAYKQRIRSTIWDCDSYLSLSVFEFFLAFCWISNNMPLLVDKKREKNTHRIKITMKSQWISRIALTFECVYSRDKLFCDKLDALKQMQTLTMSRKSSIVGTIRRDRRTSERKRETERGRESWRVSELPNDPQDTQSRCICAIVYITLLCWIYL